jgi:hypothetical protein
VNIYGLGGLTTITAQRGLFAEGRGAFGLGTANLVLNTPFIGDRSTTLIPSLAITTLGTILISSNGVAVADAGGGAPGATLAFNGESIRIEGTRLRATSGTLSLIAAEDVSISSGTVLETPGFEKQFGDAADSVRRSAPGGILRIISRTGNIDLAETSTLSVGGGKGNAGTLELLADEGVVALNATLDTVAREGAASFKLSTAGAFDLSGFLTTQSAAFRDILDIRTNAGDLVIAADQTLRLNQMRLTAGDGLVDVAGVVDVSGVNGGSIDLFGSDGVRVRSTAQLTAQASGYAATDSRRAKGGSVTLGTHNTGALAIDNGAVIDVRALRTADRLVPILRNGETFYSGVDGDQGGRFVLRAPVIEQAGADTVNATFAGSVVGAREIILEGFKRFDLETIAADTRCNNQSRHLESDNARCGPGQFLGGARRGHIGRICSRF